MKKKNKRNKYYIFTSIFLLITSILFLGFLLYFEILPTIYNSLLIITVGIIDFLLIKLVNNRRIKKWIRKVATIPILLISIFYLIVCLYLYGTIDFLSDILDNGLRSDTYSVYVLSSSKYNKIKDLENKIIGVSDINDDVTLKAIDKVATKISFNESVFDSISDSADALLNGEIDAILAIDNNVDILKENDGKYNDLRRIYSFTVNSKVKTTSSDKNVTKDNFIIYISGIDTSGKVSTKARSDVNIIVAVNPNKNKILILNTPRDYYVKLHSKKQYDKLTHAGLYGIEESINTLEDFYDINIDYYARVNFTTFINIVDKLGGIKVDVPINFCEQTSSRTSSDRICLKKGIQELNGEEALALSRTRYTVAGGDRGRIENQMLVLESILDKAMSPSIIIKYNSLLNSISDSLITNMNQKAFTRLIKKQIRSKEKWDIETFSVDGSDSSNVTYSTGSSKAYVMEPKQDTVDEAKSRLDNLLNNKETSKKEN